MRRMILWTAAGAFVVAATGLAIVMAEPNQGAAFIPGNQPVTEGQVREKLQSEGWSKVQIVQEGRYIEATASKDGQTNKIAVDSQTGRLRAADDDDGDDD
jgi:hypothetical protein